MLGEMSKATNKVRIRKSDKRRAMLTETLPYELPLLFSNDGFYQALKSNKLERFYIEYGVKIFDVKYHSVPYKYKIRKNDYESRELSIMHPLYQVVAADFYHKYESLIIGLCQRSQFSLRAPNTVASYYIERFRSLGEKVSSQAGVEESGNGFDKIPSVATSYFSYKKYAFLYRFYESGEFLELEKKFKSLTHIDVSDCFNRIYTHTISWAVKSKRFAKKFSDRTSFEKSFDELMMRINHGETAGILIGPELSRIFAEIILQRIDLDVEDDAKAEGLVVDKDYNIRRYVDDYFIFTRNDADRDRLIKIISDRLSEYKLAINHSKTNSQSRPFISATSISRHNVGLSAAEAFNRMCLFELAPGASVGPKKLIRLLNLKSHSATTIKSIYAIKRAIGSDGSYDASANYFFGTFKKKISDMVGRDFYPDANLDRLVVSFFTSIIEILFFYYSMSPRVRQTYQVSEIILMIRDIVAGCNDGVKSEIFQKIYHECRKLIEKSYDENPEHLIESMNLLIVLRSLGDSYIVGDETLLKIFGINRIDEVGYRFVSDPDYFRCVFLLCYIGGIDKYKHFIEILVDHVCGAYKDDEWDRDTQKFIMLFDLIACPYISSVDKSKLASAALKGINGNITESTLGRKRKQLIKVLSSQSWFFNWKGEANIGAVLKKKELRHPY